MRSFDLDSMEIFRAVVHEGGVLRAADKLNRVQSNVTTRVKQLEERLGVDLFQRRGRVLVLTDAGHNFLRQTERLLALADDTENLMRHSWVHGPMRLGTMESTLVARLPGYLTQFHAQNPDIHLTVETGTTDALLKKVRNHQVDAAFVSEPSDFSGLESRRVFKENLVLLTSRDTAQVGSPRDLQNDTILVFAKGCVYRRILERWFAHYGQSIDRFVDFTSYQAILACTAAGLGCGIVPESVVKTSALSESLRMHPLQESYSLVDTSLVWSPENDLKIEPLTKQLDALEQ